MSKKFLNSYKYPHPIPLPVLTTPVGDPSLPHGEQSWLRIIINHYNSTITWLSNLCKSIAQLIFPSGPIKVVYKDSLFKVTAPNDMKRIWSMGFYGKGILSRSEPTWHERQINNIDGLFSEQITQSRRTNRDIWKKHRDSLIELENNLKRESPNGELTTEHETLLEHERDRLNLIKDKIHKLPPITSSNSTTTDDLTSLDGIEYLQLSPCECLFLLQTGAIKVPDYTLESLFSYLVHTIGLQIIIDYSVYYHYRSLGWCVKPGLKFSVDFVCYSRGPPFTHAEFALKVISEDDIVNCIDLSAIMRVTNGVKKTLILVYVGDSNKASLQKHYDSFLEHGDVLKLINSLSINEVSLNRWAPSRTRQ